MEEIIDKKWGKHGGHTVLRRRENRAAIEHFHSCILSLKEPWHSRNCVLLSQVFVLCGATSEWSDYKTFVQILQYMSKPHNSHSWLVSTWNPFVKDQGVQSCSNWNTLRVSLRKLNTREYTDRKTTLVEAINNVVQIQQCMHTNPLNQSQALYIAEKHENHHSDATRISPESKVEDQVNAGWWQDHLPLLISSKETWV